MNTRKLVDPALLPVLDAFPTVALSDELLAPMRDAERFAQLPVSVDPAVTEASIRPCATSPARRARLTSRSRSTRRAPRRGRCRASIIFMAAAMSAARRAA